MPLFNIGFVIFPDLTLLDFTGPLQVLSRLPQSATHIVAKSEAPVPSDCGLGLVPTHTFANCPPLDLICVPGGNLGVVDAFCDRETIEFVRRQARTAKYVTSVCTGAIILGVAGLLKGRRATTHWAFADLLPLVGATHEKARVVKDGNVITAGGITSGIDFAFNVVAEVAGETTARRIRSASNTTRRRHSIPAIPIRHRLLSNQRCSPRATTSPCQRTAQASTRRPGFDRVGCATCPCRVSTSASHDG